jgi:hypothetical protein
MSGKKRKRHKLTVSRRGLHGIKLGAANRGRGLDAAERRRIVDIGVAFVVEGHQRAKSHSHLTNGCVVGIVM